MNRITQKVVSEFKKKIGAEIISWYHFNIWSRDTMYCIVLHMLSNDVCPSVLLSLVTLRYGVKTAKGIVGFSSSDRSVTHYSFSEHNAVTAFVLLICIAFVKNYRSLLECMFYYLRRVNGDTVFYARQHML